MQNTMTGKNVRQWNVYEEMVKRKLAGEIEYYFKNIEDFRLKFEAKKLEIKELQDSLYGRMCESLDSRYSEIYTIGEWKTLEIDYVRMDWDSLLKEHISQHIFPWYWEIKQIGEELETGLEIQKIFDEILGSFNEYLNILEEIQYDFDLLDEEHN